MVIRFFIKVDDLAKEAEPGGCFFGQCQPATQPAHGCKQTQLNRMPGSGFEPSLPTPRVGPKHPIWLEGCKKPPKTHRLDKVGTGHPLDRCEPVLS